jgi:serine protease Do
MKKFLGVVIACSLLLSACKPNEIRLSNRCLSSTVILHMKVSIHEKGFQKDKQGWGTCSGVYVSPNLVLTANHCVDMPKGIKLKEIWVGNITGESAKANVVKIDPTRDLALLKTELKGIPVRLARDVRVGEDCWVVGNPLGLEFVITKGIVSSTDVGFDVFPRDHFITDATILPGNSGGAAFNSKGQLIGIVVMSTSLFGGLGASGLGIVVQINEVKYFLTHR